MSRLVKLINWFLGGILLVAVAYGIQTANASSESRTPDVTATTETVVGGNSSKALGLGFSYSLGDVDLNEGKNCYVSTASGNIIFGRQKVELNPWCAALFYDANRMHEFAARQRCQLPGIMAEYETKADCVLGQTIAPLNIVLSPVIDEVQYQQDEDDRDEKSQLQDQHLEALNERLDTLEQARIASVRRASRQQAKDRQYAQQILDELEEYK